MNTNEMLKFYDCLAKTKRDCNNCPDYGECAEVENEIRSLIENFGGTEEKEAQLFDIEGQKLSRADILRLPIEKRREILEKQTESAKEYYHSKETDNNIDLMALTDLLIHAPKPDPETGLLSIFMHVSSWNQLLSLIESSGKRTVSREVVNQIWNDIKERGQYGLAVCLQELGYTIEEPKGGVEVKNER